MIVKKKETWHRLPRHVDRIESIAVAVGLEPLYHKVMMVDYEKFVGLDDTVIGLPTLAVLHNHILGLWPKPNDYMEISITATEIFHL